MRVERDRYRAPTAAEDAAADAAEQRQFHRIAWDRLCEAWQAIEELDRADRDVLLAYLDEIKGSLGDPDDDREAA